MVQVRFSAVWKIPFSNPYAVTECPMFWGLFTRQNWNRSEHVSMAPSLSRRERARSPLRDGEANRLPLLAAMKDVSFLTPEYPSSW